MSNLRLLSVTRLAALSLLALGACSSSETSFSDQGVADAKGEQQPPSPDQTVPGADGPAPAPDGPAPSLDGPVPSPDGPVPSPDGPGPDAGVPDTSVPDTSVPDTGGGPGGDTLNTGDESGDQPATGEVGAPCGKDGDCKDHPGTGGDDSQGAVCLTEASDKFPGGYCSFLASKPASLNWGCNAAGGVYVPYSKTWGDGYCYHACVAPKDCRVGYRCVDKACMPDCATQGCKLGACDPAKKVCLAK